MEITEEQKQYKRFLAEQVVKEGEAEDFLRQHFVKRDRPSLEELLKDIGPEGLGKRFEAQVWSYSW